MQHMYHEVVFQPLKPQLVCISATASQGPRPPPNTLRALIFSAR